MSCIVGSGGYTMLHMTSILVDAFLLVLGVEGMIVWH